MTAAPSLGDRMASGAAWMILLRLADRIIGFVSIAILARILVPADFGIVALAAAVIAMVELFGDLRLETALIRDRRDGRAAMDSAWTLRLLVALALAAAMVAAAPVAAAMLEDGRLTLVVMVLAAATLIDGFENIGTVEFQRRLDFRRDFSYRFWSRILATAVTIAAAIVWRDYWALVAGTVARSAIRVALSYRVHPFRPRPSLAAARALLSFSSWLMVDNLIVGLNRRLSDFIVARWLGVEALAYFSTASELANLATTEIQAPIRRAIYPGFAEMAGDAARLTRGFVESLGVLFAAGAPVAAGIALAAPEIVLVLLGPQWTQTVPLVQILAIAGIVTALRTGSHVVYLALGRPQLNTWLSGSSLAISVPALTVGVWLDGVTGAAWGMVARAAIMLAVDYAILWRLLGVGPGALARAAWRPVGGLVVMALAVAALRDHLPAASTTLAALPPLAACVAAGAAAYVGTVAALWLAAGRPAGAERRALGFARAAWTRLAAARGAAKGH
ncbi:MAG: oligosaccharide flippase family protein [Rhodospirillales bacterium]